MKNGLVIADAGPIFSLAIIEHLYLLDELFDEIKIPNAVWIEISSQEENFKHEEIVKYFKSKIQTIKSFNDLVLIMDVGESEAVILYKETDENFLLIDDKKARRIAEFFGINCIGTIGVLIIAKNKGLIKSLKPLFLNLINYKRYYSIELLNSVLLSSNEDEIKL